MDCTLAGSDGRAPVFRPGQMYRRIRLPAVSEGAGESFFSFSCPDCVFLALSDAEKNAA